MPPPSVHGTHRPIVSRRSLTRIGLLWLLITIAPIGISLFRSINLLLMLTCLMLALLLLNWLLAGRRLKHLRARRRLPQPIFAGTPLTIDIDVTSVRGTVPAMRIEDRGDAHAVAWFLRQLRSGEVLRLRRSIALLRRGRYPWPAVRALSGYPFGLVARRAELTPAEEIIVLPRLGRVDRGRLRRRLTMAAPLPACAHRPTRRDLAAQSEFHGLRTFRSGDSPRWIHSRTSARRGELMVREFADEWTEDLLVILDLGGQPSALAVEAAVSLAATVCWEWCRRKGDRLTLAVGVDPVLISGVTGEPLALRLLECLAVQSAAETERGFLMERLTRGPLPRAAVLLVTARADGFADELARRLGRPIVCVDAADLSAADFYEEPADHDA